MTPQIATTMVIVILSSLIGQISGLMECGRISTTPIKRIVGGSKADEYTWPWMVSLNADTPAAGTPGSKRGHFCGGVLVHKQWVLTAAHCLDDPDVPNNFSTTPKNNWRVTAGINARSPAERKKGFWQDRKMKKIFPHPLFKDYNVTAFNDIALIQLDKPFHYTDRVRPICLSKTATKPGWQRCYSAGWGTKGEKHPHYSITLQQVPILIVNSKVCTDRFGQSYSPYHHICGGDWFNGKKDACKGDSGGPLACKRNDGSWYVSGIVSWGIGCGRKNTPGVYTKVVTYQRWIKSVLIKNTRRAKPSAVPKGMLTQRQKRNAVGSLDVLL